MKTRKLFVVILALVLTMSMTATAFAAAGSEEIPRENETFPGAPTTIDVTGTYSDTHTSSTVYSVDISWGAMNFTYSISGSLNWNPKTHAYDNNENIGWTADGNTIITANHSNKAVNVAFAFAKDETNAPSVTGSFNNESYTLPTADVGDSLNDPTKAPTNSSTLTISGTLDPDKKDVKIGTVTVTLSEVVAP